MNLNEINDVFVVLNFEILILLCCNGEIYRKQPKTIKPHHCRDGIIVNLYLSFIYYLAHILYYFINLVPEQNDNHSVLVENNHDEFIKKQNIK